MEKEMQLIKQNFVPKLKAFSLARIAGLFACAVFALATASCSNLDGDIARESGAVVGVGTNPGAGGTLTASVAFPDLPAAAQPGANEQSDGVTKSAFPEMAEITASTDFYFAATLESSGGASYSANGVYNSSTAKYDFDFIGAVKLTAQTYTLTVTLNRTSGVTSTAIASASKEVTVPAAANSFEASVRLNPKTGDGLAGFLSLPIKFDDTNVKSVAVQLMDSSGADKASAYLSATSFAVDGAGKTSITSNATDGIPAGAYTLLMTFKDSGGAALGSRAETLTVFATMQTNRWWTGAGTVLTLQISDTATQTEYWVRGTGGDFYSQSFATGWAAADTNQGVFAAPLETLQAAVDKIEAAGDTTTEYTIYIDGTVSAGTSPAFKGDTDFYKSLAYISGNRKIKITGWSGSDKDIIDCNSKCRGITVASVSAKVKITNLTITNGGDVENGGAIYSNGTLVIASGNISYNDASNGGGAIYSASGSSVSISGGSLVKNHAKFGGAIMNLGECFVYGSAVIGDSSAIDAPTSSANASNYATSYGGGIYNYNGKLYLGYSAYTDESANTPAALAGGIYANWSDAHAAGIYNVGASASVKIASGNIKFNGLPTGSHQGAGIWTRSQLEMTGGLIAFNKGDMGAGVCVTTSDGSFTMGGGTISENISDNSSAGGGGVLVGDSAIFTMNGGTIEKNTAARGGGVWNNDGVTSITGGTISQNKAVYGAGLCVFTSDFTSAIKSVATMTGGTIDSNTGAIGATSYGGGVYVERNSKFSMSVGTISQNSTTYGGAVFINLASDASSWGTFEMSGAAYIPAGVGAASGEGKNDVQTTVPLIITDALTATPTPVATITPLAYDVSMKVLDGTAALLSANYGKFAVADDSSGGKWTVNSLGYLAQLGSGGGSITIHTPEGDLNLAASATTITTSASDTTVTISATDSSGAAITNGLTWNGVTVYYGADEIDSGAGSSYKFLKAFPKGTYRMVVSVTYKGTTYSDTITVTKTVDPVAIPAGFVGVEGATVTGGGLTPTSSVFISGRTVAIGNLFVSDHELTQGEYEIYCKYGETAPGSSYGKGTNYPAYYVNWYDAIVYCNLRSKAEGLTPVYKIGTETDPTKWSGIVPGTGTDAGKYCGPSSDNTTWNGMTFDTTANGYRLPTEAEWEYIARNKNQDSYTYSGSNTIDNVAWYTTNAGSKTHEVKADKIAGTDSANGLGIYDMTGNVWEWCWDYYNTIYTSTSATGPSGASSESYRVYRGGCWGSVDSNCSVANRDSYGPYNRSFGIGFRVVRNAP
ncbi:MAG: formylglycine-generating enzyme family protein [Treponema sp.]|nr:formylglycine-generating enzyme family protein [Treponema sp.]